MNKLILITGGARSGKSTFAEKLALEINNKYHKKKKSLYIATSEIIDDEFKNRVDKHKKRRGELFKTFEEAIKIDEVIKNNCDLYNVFLIECITTWLGNIFYKIESSEVEEIAYKIIDNVLSIIKNKENIQNFYNEDIIKFDYSNFENKYNIFHNFNENNQYFIIVTNEIGLGIVPGDPVIRKFRDIQGWINQKIACFSDAVFFTVSGIPMQIK